MAFGLEALVPALIAGAVTTGISALAAPKMPAFPNSEGLPQPVAPPGAPLTPTDTAAQQRARSRAMSSPNYANKDIMLAPNLGQVDEPMVARTTLLGR